MTITNTEALPATTSGKPWTIHSSGRLHNGLIVGPVGSGKSTALRAVAREAAGTGCDIWLADPQAGASGFPPERAERFAGDPAKIRSMLHAAADIIARRAELDLAGWEAGSGIRGLLVLVEEFPWAFDSPECQQLAYEVARCGNAVGVAIVAAGQNHRLSSFSGNPIGMALREALASAGNLALLEQSAERSEGKAR